MKVVVLASGSKGNCCYVEAGETKVIIDCGVSLKETLVRMKRRGISIKGLNAILISHDHSDHIGHLERFLNNTNAVLYINPATFSATKRRLHIALENYPHVFIEADARYKIGDLSVVPIELSHDVANCLGFLFREDATGATFGIVTDTGILKEKYFDALSYMDVLVLESNHDPKMLAESGRPYQLIERIASDYGHLSNNQCVDYFNRFYHGDNKLIILGHLSEECNDYELAVNYFKEHAKEEMRVIAALQRDALPLIEIGDEVIIHD